MRTLARTRCPNCFRIFNSQRFGLTAGTVSVTGCKEPCIYCGHEADIEEVRNGVQMGWPPLGRTIESLRANTPEQLVELRRLIDSVRAERISPQVANAQAERINRTVARWFTFPNVLSMLGLLIAILTYLDALSEPDASSSNDQIVDLLRRLVEQGQARATAPDPNGGPYYRQPDDPPIVPPRPLMESRQVRRRQERKRRDRGAK